MRLLPVRADHEGGGAACQQSEAEPPADHHPYGRQHLPLRNLQPHHRRGRTRVEGGLGHDNRTQVAGDDPPRHARRHRRHDILFCVRHRRHAHPAARRCRHAARTAVAMGADRARRHHHNSHGYRDGSGLRHVHSADDRGRDGCRLVQGDARMGAFEPGSLWLARSQRPPRHDGHRQPCRDDVLERPAHRGRAGAQGADRECRREMGRRCRNAQDRAERGHRPELGKAIELWRDRGLRQGAGAAAGRRQERAEGAERLPPDRAIGAAARSAVQGQRHGAIFHRREIAGHGLCQRPACAGERQHAGEMERCRDQGHARRDRDREAAAWRRHRGGKLPAGDGGAPRAARDLEQEQGRRLRFRKGAGALCGDPRRHCGAGEDR